MLQLRYSSCAVTALPLSLRFRSDGILQTDLLSTERLTRAGEVDPSQAMNNEVLSAIQSGRDE